MLFIKLVSGIIVYGLCIVKWKYGCELCGKVDCYKNRNKLNRQNVMELLLYIKDKLVLGKWVVIFIMIYLGIELLGKQVLDVVMNGEIYYYVICVLNECFL